MTGKRPSSVAPAQRLRGPQPRCAPSDPASRGVTPPGGDGEIAARVGRRHVLGGLGRFGRAALGAALLVAVGIPGGGRGFLAPAAHGAPNKRGRLAATRYFTLSPFTLPLIDGGVITEQMTLVVALELADEEEREEVARLVPKIRDAMYRELYAMVTFRRKGSPLPDVDRFKVRLYRVVRGIASEKRVKSLLVQQAFQRPVR